MKERFLRFLSFPDAVPSPSDYAAYFSALPFLQTPSLFLRPMLLSDAQDIFSYSSDPEVARYVLWEPHRSVRDTRAYIRYVRSLYRSGQPSSWVIGLKASGQIIGTIGFMWASPENRSAEVGYSLSRLHWNHGYATEALSAVLRSAFQSLNLNRIEAQWDLRNPASGRVMEKCGMHMEGVLRSRIYNKGEFIDVAVCSILRKEYKLS